MKRGDFCLETAFGKIFYIDSHRMNTPDAVRYVTAILGNESDARQYLLSLPVEEYARFVV